MGPLLSIIIPVYNAEKYLYRCIGSILSQSYTNLELILVNDGSTDDSGKICDKFTQRDNRVIAIHVPNAGPSRARNIGLSAASGKWVMFVDADDWLDEDAFSIFETDLLSADIVFFGYKCVYPTYAKVNIPKQVSLTVSKLEIDRELATLISSKEQYFGFSVNKFFLKSIIDGKKISFPDGLSVREDELFTLRYVKYIKSLLVLPSAPYNYRMLDSSLSHVPNKYRNYKKLYELVKEEIESLSFEESQKEFLNKCMSYYWCAVMEALKFKKDDLYEIISSLSHFFDKYYRKTYFPAKIRYCLSFPMNAIRKELLIGYFKQVYYKTKFLENMKSVYIKCRLFNLKSYRFSKKLASCGVGLKIKEGVWINNPLDVTLGKNCVLDRNSSIVTNKISEKTPCVYIGNSVLIGAYSSISCSNEVRIEDNVMLAPHVHITDRNHIFEDVTIPIRHQSSVSPGSVIIGESSWLGFGSQIMPNVHIGKHCVVAAGAVVTKNIPDYCVVAGNPARVIKKYNFETQKWEKM